MVKNLCRIMKVLGYPLVYNWSHFLSKAESTLQQPLSLSILWNSDKAGPTFNILPLKSICNSNIKSCMSL